MKHVTSLLLCLICWLPLSFSGTPENGPERVQSEFSCNLPAPSNLAASNVGPTQFDLTWSAVSGAYGYRIEVLDPNNNTLYDNVIIGTSATITSMPPGTTLTVRARTLCAVNEIGEEEASILVSTNIIIDLIAASFEGSCPTNGAQIATQQLQYQSPAQPFLLERNKYYLAEFREDKKNDISLSTFFRIIIIDTEETLRIEMQQEGIYLPAGDLTNAAGASLPPLSTYLPFISYTGNNQQQRLRITVENNGGISDDKLIVCLIANSPSRFYFGITPCGEKKEGKQREELNSSDLFLSSNYKIYPNPFSNSLNFTHVDIFDNTFRRVSILDVNGKCLYSSSKQDITTINTSSFDNGVYFIKIETENKIDVFRVVKSE